MQEAPELSSTPDLAADLAADLTIVGLELRTRPESAAAELPALWQRFMGEGVAGKLPAADGHLYAVYCDYQDDFRGGYTVVLGVATDARAEVPAGMRRVRVPAGRYARFAVSGDPAEVVWGAWQHINGAWPRRGDRRYLADYERYSLAAMTPGHAELEVCVGLLAE